MTNNALFNHFFEHINDAGVAGLTIETEYQPLNGQGSPVAPPTYAPRTDDKTKHPVYAQSESVFLPVKGQNGWYDGILRNKKGRPVTVPRVTIDGVASESGRAETCLWQKHQELGLELPGIVIEGTPNGQQSATVKKNTSSNADQDKRIAASVKDSLEAQVSSWDLGHRHVDGWVKYASDNEGHQVWSGGAIVNGINVKDVITNASAENADLLYRYLPNSATYGFWLAAGTAKRHRLPRAYSSEIVGYNAQPVKRGATKLDPTGGVSNQSVIAASKSELRVAPKGNKPSEFGFGQIPSPVEIRGFSCELILQRASIMLPVLHQLRFSNAEVAPYACTTLTLLAAVGNVLASRDGWLRSECALIPVETKWGWRRAGTAEIETIETPSLDDLVAALKESIAQTAEHGLSFQEPLHLRYSGLEQHLIADRVTNEETKQQESKDEG